MANTKISQLTNLTTPTWNEEFVYAYNNANGKITLDTMKTFVWWAGITTLNADANIWELSDWFYETTYLLYYKTGEVVETVSSSSTLKQMISVVTDASWTKWYFVFSGNSYIAWHAYFGYSKSSSEWKCYQLWAKDWALRNALLQSYTSIDSFQVEETCQIIDNISDWTNALTMSSGWREPYPWVTYTLYIAWVASWKTYTITLWTWVTNPFNITLPTNSNKKALITLLCTGTSTGIVTWCTIES